MPANPESSYPDAVAIGNINDATSPDYSEDGVDLTLIRWMLSLSPLEHIQFLEARINDIQTIRELNATR